MKNIFSITLIYVAFTLNSLCQQMPDDIQATLNKLKAETRTSLDDNRTNRNTRGFHVGLIQWALPDEQRKKAEQLNLKLDMGMIYDNSMRNRLLQLLKNEYRTDELDTLTKRYLADSKYAYEYEALKYCKFDTMKLFKNSLDSFYNEEKLKKPKDYGYTYFYNYDVFKILKLDTTEIFKQVLDSVMTKEKENFIYDLKSDNYRDLSSTAELCGYINDKRFIQPLIEALNKPNNFRREVVIKALARMKVEPYYTNLLKNNIHTLSEVISGISIDYTIFTDVLRSQESFLELSKYMKSNIPCIVTSESTEEELKRHGNEFKFCILQIIYNNLDNADMKTLVWNGADKIYVPYDITPEWDAAVDKLYNWMQKNYGKYKINWYHY